MPPDARLFSVLDALKANYGDDFTDAGFIRDGIGSVYSVNTGGARYALKIFSPRHGCAAKVSAGVMDHLKRSGVSVPGIRPCANGDLWFFHEGRACVLYEFIDGGEVDNLDFRLDDKAILWGNMRRAMENCPVDAPVHGREFFVDRYLDIMRLKNYPRTDEFEKIGGLLWSMAEKMPRGFVHGDFHAGNLLDMEGNLVVYDFDACAIFTPLYDVAAMCDATDYFSLDDKNFSQGCEKTRAYAGTFLKKCPDISHALSGGLEDILALVALRHFDIQATIIERWGADRVENAFFDRQLTWLKKWIRECAIG